MLNLNEENLKRIKGVNLMKSATALMLSATMLTMASCGENTKNNDESKSSFGISIDASKIKNNGSINEEVLKDLYSAYGFMDLIEGKYDLDEMKVYSNNQKKAIYEIAKHLELHLNASDKEIAKKELIEVAKYIEEFYGDKNTVEVMREILSKLLPEDVHVSKDNKRLENKNGEVLPLGMNEGIFDMDYFVLFTLLTQGYAYGYGEISEEIENINLLISSCGIFRDSLLKFTNNNGQSYLADKRIFVNVLSNNEMYDKLYNEGIFDNFNVVFNDNGDFDIRVGNQKFYTLTFEENENVVSQISGYLNDNKISSDVLKNSGMIRMIIMEFVKMSINKGENGYQKVM